MIDFTEIPEDGEVWELFARDFLQELGFFIESSPDRGPDGGKDLVVTEALKGNLGDYKFRWLVSCKHFAKSNKSVQERDELNIRERIESHNADGFIGFYSTIASSGLNGRLRELRENGKIKDYRVFDHQEIESHLISRGFSQMLMRYFPRSHKAVKPLHLVGEKYYPLECSVCGKDLLESLYHESYSGNIVFVRKVENIRTENKPALVEDVYWACKGNCDWQLSSGLRNAGYATTWNDIADLAIPALFIDWIFAILRKSRKGEFAFADKAFEKLVDFILALSQKVLREMTEEDRERATTVFSLPVF